jgi:hypothetical protein
MAYNVMRAAIKSSPECIDSDRIPRLFVQDPIANFKMVRDADAIIEMTATLTFSSSVLFPFSNRIDFIVGITTTAHLLNTLDLLL